MKIVLDTNVLISGLLSPDGTPGFIIRLVASGHIELYYDFRIINEYKSVMARPKFGFLQQNISDFLDQIKSGGCLITPLPLTIELPDQEDLKFLEVAVSAGSEYLVTGNFKHFPFLRFKQVKIVSPAEFFKTLITKTPISR